MAAKLLIIGNIGSGKSTLASGLARRLGWPQLGIDECRRAIGDGSAAREVAAWAAFLEEAQRPARGILDCSGTGPFAHLLRHALKQSGLPIFTYWLHTPVEVCAQRVSGRTWSTPYPDFGVPLERVLQDVAGKLEREARDPRLWPCPVIEIDGLLPQAAILEKALAHLPAESTEVPSTIRAGAAGVSGGLTLTELAQRVTRWAGACPGVEALLFYGSFARRQAEPASDLDAALLMEPGVSMTSIAASLEREFAAELTADRAGSCTLQDGRQRVYWLGPTRRKLDLLLCSQPEELRWIAEASDVPAPRLVVASARPGARIDSLLASAQQEVNWTRDELRARADLEVEKFLVSLDASYRASQLGDDYAAYFQYNLALHQLIRLIQLARGGACHLYLPRALITRHLDAAEAATLRTLAPGLNRSGLPAQALRLYRFFLDLVPELNDRLGCTRTVRELEQYAAAYSGMDGETESG